MDDEIKKYLSHALMTGQLHHAYGIIGQNHGNTIKEIIANLMCLNQEGKKRCGTCMSCIADTQGTHPDVTFYQSENGESIGIATVREITHIASITPQLMTHRIIAVLNAQQLTESASNGLLKIIEEPPGNAIFFIGATHEDALSLTLRSRLHIFRLSETYKTSLSDEEQDFWTTFLRLSIGDRPKHILTGFPKKMLPQDYKKKVEYGILFLQSFLHTTLHNADASEHAAIVEQLSVLQRSQQQLAQNVNSKMIVDMLIISL